VLFSTFGLRSIWPEDWRFYLGLAAGIGMIVSGLAAAFPKVPIAGQLFGAVGTLGILLLVAWSLASGIRLVSGR
jgi:hypothetical protein